MLEECFIASLYLASNKSGSFVWQIYGLSNDFNQSNYKEVGVTKYQFTSASNGASSISGIVSYQTAPSYHAQNSSDTVEASYENGYHTFWGYAKAANGLYYAAGSGSVQIGMPRPHDWTWRDMYAGSPILSASEWNRFCDRINEFREYKDKSKYSFTYVRSGDVFYAYIFNEARNTIESMAYVSVSRKYSGDIVYASDFKSLSSALNAIN